MLQQLTALWTITAPYTRLIGYARPLNAVQPLLGVYLGYLLAGASNVQLLLAAMVSVFVIHSVVTVWNDIEDELGDRKGGRYHVASWRKHPVYVHLPVVAVIVVGASIAVVELYSVLTAALIGVLVLLGWIYNARPIQASHRPVASMAVLFLSYGLLPVLIGGSIGGHHVLVALFALFWGINRLSLSLLKDYKDALADAKSHKKTFLLVFGGKRTAWLSLVCADVGFAGTIVLLYVHRPQLSILCLVVAATALIYERLQLFKVDSYAELSMVFKRSSEYQIIFEAAVVAWLTIF